MLGNLYLRCLSAGLHLSGANGSTSFPDLKGHSFYRTGAVAISTAQSRFAGEGSAYFPGGVDDLIKCDAHADFGDSGTSMAISFSFFPTAVPVGQDVRPEPAIEILRRCVPVEDGPLEAPAAALLRDSGQLDEEGGPAAAASECRAHEQILEGEPGTTQKRGVVREVQGVARRLRVARYLREQHLDRRLRAEQCGVEIRLGTAQQVFQVLVACEIPDEAQDLRDVLAARRTDLEGRGDGHGRSRCSVGSIAAVGRRCGGRGGP